jgi:phosphinothricin acetyltransferase
MYEIGFASPSDAEELLSIYKPFILNTPITFECDVPTVEQFTERISSIQKAYPYLVCKQNGRIVGYAYASKHRERSAYRWSFDTSVYIDPTYQRKGIGTALYTALLALCKAQGFRNAYAIITYPNDNSIRLHEKFGFDLIGKCNSVGFKLNKWLDVVYMELVLQKIDSTPEEPKKPQDIDSDSLFKDCLLLIHP